MDTLAFRNSASKMSPLAMFHPRRRSLISDDKEAFDLSNWITSGSCRLLTIHGLRSCRPAFEHVANEQQTLSELYRVLKPGGHLILAYLPQEWSLAEWYLRVTHGWPHPRRYTMSSIKRMLLGAGFHPVGQCWHHSQPLRIRWSWIAPCSGYGVHPGPATVHAEHHGGGREGSVNWRRARRAPVTLRP